MSGDNSKVDAEQIRNLIQDAHINFLIGSGASSPYLSTLKNLEVLSDELGEQGATDDQKSIVQASLDYAYYSDAMRKNLDILTEDEALAVLKSYEMFIATIHSVLALRANPLLPKQVNLFTTNVDIFLENAFDRTGIELNDGFKGRLNPTYRLDNFRTRLFKLTLQYDNSAEVPVFNLFKLHGSLSWMLDKSGSKQRTICLDRSLQGVNDVSTSADAASDDVLPVNDKSTAQDLVKAAGSGTVPPTLADFAEKYNELLVVNPTKEKFETTVLQQTYYDLLRVFSNELEREASVLLVVGFSFADEHIRALTVRAANSNPTLFVYVFCHSSKSKTEIEAEFSEDVFTYNNVKFVSPEEVGVEFLDLETVVKVLFEPIIEQDEDAEKADEAQ